MKKEKLTTSMEQLYETEILRAKNLNVTFKSKDGDLRVVRNV